MHPFPLIDALWASLDVKRPSGDDPKRVAFALTQFYGDFQKQFFTSRKLRWRTPLFESLEPKLEAHIQKAIDLTASLAQALPDASNEELEKLKTLDHKLREAAFQLQVEEENFDLAKYASPKLSQFNYLFEGWKRGLLTSGPFSRFLGEYLNSVAATLQEIETATQQVEMRESEVETAAIESALTAVRALQQSLLNTRSLLSKGPQACRAAVEETLLHGERLGEAFETLEQCSPLRDPCPFCGGQLSLSGRCRGCARRLPHLEEQPTGKIEATSIFSSHNCRKVDLAFQHWDAKKEDLSLWKNFQNEVLEFSAQVAQGRKSLELLSTASDRPIDSESELRKKEHSMKAVAEAFQEAVTTLSQFSRQTEPPSQSLQSGWREPLLEAEKLLQAIESSVAPES